MSWIWKTMFSDHKITAITTPPQVIERKPVREHGIIYAVNIQNHLMLQTYIHKNIAGDLLALYPQLWNNGDYYQLTNANGTISYGSPHTRKTYNVRGAQIVVDFTFLS